MQEENGVDMQLEGGTVEGHHSGLGRWLQRVARGRRAEKKSQLLPKKSGVVMVAANGTLTRQRHVRFRGFRSNSVFAGPDEPSVLRRPCHNTEQQK